MCDAFYKSSKEPWSAFLTGQMGQSPGYDPLAFAVEEAHRRGIELHAWVNPYRARPSGSSVAPSPDHLINTRPDLAKKYGRSYWLDPGEPEVQQHSLDVIMDIVRRYDIDAIHIDDYFYPYAESDSAGNKLEFPDEPSWGRYRTGGGALTRGDWRRENVNTFVRNVYRSIKATKPWVRFGISPFGVFRPGYPAQIVARDMYEELYADSRKWLVEGWCDYYAPQLYWRIEPTAQSYPVLLSWWTQNNPKRRHIWPGLYTSRAVSEWNSNEEIEWQVKIARGFAESNGTVHFSMAALKEGGLNDTDEMAGYLKATVYQRKALPPACPWLSPGAPDPALSPSLSGGIASWQLPPTGVPRFWAVQFRVNKEWQLSVLPGTKTSHNAPRGCDAFAIRAIDRAGVASDAMVAVAR
jgi:uncharacterized lipoprotein YddW (UPF0748 family)